MTTTQHLQKVILMMMKDIDKLCQKNGIEYYLYAGSALGAKRHKGFIPWDDDLDIILLPPMYDKFINICKSHLDKNKYLLQEGLVDWTGNFSKIRLKNTHIQEIGDNYTNNETDGIYIDVFRADYASNTKFGRMWQYIMGKLWLTNNLDKRGYKGHGVSKKTFIIFSRLLNIPFVYNFVMNEYLKYNKLGIQTNWVSDVFNRTRWNNAFIPLAYYGKPTEIRFEDSVFYAQEQIDKYLSITYGNYMQLPPEDKRVGLHIVNIDFGNY